MSHLSLNHKRMDKQKNLRLRVCPLSLFCRLLGKENKSASTGLPPKEAPLSTPASAIVREDLDLEAVIAGQENACLNVGKAPHPFFARKKPSSLKPSFLQFTF
ncbi:unnamed protein product [Calypogeia fissa]